VRFGTTYYRLLDWTFSSIAALYRIRYSATALEIERYDPEAAAWKPGPSEILRYVNGGEIGADEISKTEAEDLIAAGRLPPLPLPIG
jgi:hypothetical protein